MSSNSHGFYGERELFEKWGKPAEHLVLDEIVGLYEAPNQAPSTKKIDLMPSVNRKIMEQPYILVLLEDLSIVDDPWHIYAAILIDFRLRKNNLSTCIPDKNARLKRERFRMLVENINGMNSRQHYALGNRKVGPIGAPTDVQLKAFHCHDSFGRRSSQSLFDIGLGKRQSSRVCGKFQLGDEEACVITKGSPAFLNKRTCNVVKRDSDMERNLADQESRFHRKVRNMLTMKDQETFGMVVFVDVRSKGVGCVVNHRIYHDIKCKDFFDPPI